MAATPPPRSPVVDCPPTPLWPARFEHPRELRRSTRIAASKAEPSTPTRSDRSTPPPTIKRDKAARNLFGTSTVSSSINEQFDELSTQVQTPKKKKAQTPHTPSSIHRSGKPGSRLSRFSLDQRNDNPIPIFEDSNARIPEPIEEEEDNIFKSSSRPSAFSIKRRKTPVTAESDFPTEDGMIVVQRGRKSYKKFDDRPIFDGPMPRKKLFAEPVLQPVDTDDEETEREESVEPPSRIVRFTEVTTTTTSSGIMNTPAKASKVQSKTPHRTPKSHVQINDSFLTPPATVQRDRKDIASSFEEGGLASRNSVKRKLSYSGPATPEPTPAKKRGRIADGPSRGEDVFLASPTRTRRAAKPRS